MGATQPRLLTVVEPSTLMCTWTSVLMNGNIKEDYLRESGIDIQSIAFKVVCMVSVITDLSKCNYKHIAFNSLPILSVVFCFLR